jgi:hypothetical protein
LTGERLCGIERRTQAYGPPGCAHMDEIAVSGPLLRNGRSDRI